MLLPTPVKAGLFSGILRFLVPEDSKDQRDSAYATVTLPLMGSAHGMQGYGGGAGVGGASGDESPVLSATLDSALVASRNPAGTLPASDYGQILIYTVVPGDTPSSIAERFGISLNTLLWANNIRNPNLIKIGDELVILPVSGVRYEVKRGDTIESLAKKFKGDAIEILNFNGLTLGEALDVGSVVIIPDGELVTPPAVPASNVKAGVSRLPEYRGYYMRPIFSGRRSRGLHGFNGIDLADSCGLPVLAAAEGTIIIARPSGWNGGYGKHAVISHPNGTQTLYAHLSSILGRVGQHVAQGSQIATIGTTGNSTGCHVHFEVRGARNPF